MRLAFTLLDWQASAPGLGELSAWQQWSAQPAAVDATGPLTKCDQLPMMTARRLNSGSRMAVNNGLALLRRQPEIEAIVFTSRHGELERNLRILLALSKQESLSPTDFAMSVHNSAVGSLTIAAQAPLVSTSISAGIDSFQQGLLEVAALQSAGYSHVLLVDFDGAIPEFYHSQVAGQMPRYPYAVALLLAPGSALNCETRSMTGGAAEPALPQSLQFLHGWLSHKPTFTIDGERHRWQWTTVNHV
ncbi:beta-ketoacyl synthase chain length factor [Dickeya dadantii]|uniref:beta-ketoacyl synthase chain length factor n=1 Tax=Dickeya dadantii TaxID=204038 RepID=UPI0014956A09|nr:beta-ketoacyl synthase chain length factor [Dickeya dadantii]NPE58157.1 beta-ketoacyl synthase chain length factor [Dickeya dadantii]NPE71008.1 beta-ketoacyl synthase chain length factor [Dickeya dadantii]